MIFNTITKSRKYRKYREFLSEFRFFDGSKEPGIPGTFQTGCSVPGSEPYCAYSPTYAKGQNTILDHFLSKTSVVELKIVT